jgi:hypothetical protein
MSKSIKLIGLILVLANVIFAQRVEKCQLYIKTDPEGAIIKCNGELQGASPTTMKDLEMGTYIVSASLKGYKTVYENVSFDSPSMRAALEIEMEPELGLVLVKTEPEGAEVEIGDKTYGTTPLLINSLRFGEYEVLLKKSGFDVLKIPLVINNRRPILIDKALASDTATLIISSEPSDADVTVNGVPKGTTPCTISGVRKGEVRIEISLDSYESLATTMLLAPNQQEKIDVKLKSLPSSLEITSNPGSARIYINGKFKGIAPVKEMNIEPGNYMVSAELEGYETLEQNISVGRGEDSREEFRLESNAGSLEIITAPSGVKILVDGKEYGKTKSGQDDSDEISAPLLIDSLAAGEHVVTFTRSKFFPASQSINIVKGEKTKLQKNLNRKFEPDCSVITTDGVSYKGEFVETAPGGGKIIETAPGIFKTLESDKIRSFELLENFEL